MANGTRKATRYGEPQYQEDARFLANWFAEQNPPRDTGDGYTQVGPFLSLEEMHNLSPAAAAAARRTNLYLYGNELGIPQNVQLIPKSINLKNQSLFNQGVSMSGPAGVAPPPPGVASMPAPIGGTQPTTQQNQLMSMLLNRAQSSSGGVSNILGQLAASGAYQPEFREHVQNMYDPNPQYRLAKETSRERVPFMDRLGQIKYGVRQTEQNRWLPPLNDVPPSVGNQSSARDLEGNLRDLLYAAGAQTQSETRLQGDALRALGDIEATRIGTSGRNALSVQDLIEAQNRVLALEDSGASAEDITAAKQMANSIAPQVGFPLPYKNEDVSTLDKATQVQRKVEKSRGVFGQYQLPTTSRQDALAAAYMKFRGINPRLEEKDFREFKEDMQALTERRFSKAEKMYRAFPELRPVLGPPDILSASRMEEILRNSKSADQFNKAMQAESYILEF